MAADSSWTLSSIPARAYAQPVLHWYIQANLYITNDPNTSI